MINGIKWRLGLYRLIGILKKLEIIKYWIYKGIEYELYIITDNSCTFQDNTWLSDDNIYNVFKFFVMIIYIFQVYTFLSIVVIDPCSLATTSIKFQITFQIKFNNVLKTSVMPFILIPSTLYSWFRSAWRLLQTSSGLQPTLLKSIAIFNAYGNTVCVKNQLHCRLGSDSAEWSLQQAGNYS